MKTILELQQALQSIENQIDEIFVSELFCEIEQDDRYNPGDLTLGDAWHGVNRTRLALESLALESFDHYPCNPPAKGDSATISSAATLRAHIASDQLAALISSDPMNRSIPHDQNIAMAVKFADLLLTDLKAKKDAGI
ncbi:MAG: hypothetical protein JGK30_07800 [Microcoleus sp. PH2017_40_RAT_O_B]|uniref:hypothetical protein n=1 Tax=unclassified Microcoleus TaxID=2642155 RepID=UPI001DA65556|nr:MULTISPECIES: hypothetical protein [unclassified Microcoleus]MCC3564491.1 hypothetical protein [Microcoleus sp. PH2017_31_RDM_U_A]MCC3572180.1 hypothetical protein [Microcoleus sp. PH2017_34_RAT_O_A]MCC3577948.1 hypothetical protein [Microcoleus sp. PH2017_32_RDM_D_A]MCC3609405.1 hypothetical protein [Microcoleus sp. PH2017_40_RAT_O_B]MCC3615637.1 hypothetical protein [Microcoleus sp. PH2017_38_RDM_U_B]